MDSSVTPFLFNGLYGVMSDANGLYYMRARFYSPEIRRFVNRDILLGGVVSGQTLNRFAFVTGNPISYVDPEGKLGFLAGFIIVNAAILAYDIYNIVTFDPSDYEFDGGELVPVGFPILEDLIGGAAKGIQLGLKSCINSFAKNLVSSEQDIQKWIRAAGQVGLRKPKQIDKMKADMLADEFDFDDIKGRIAVIIDSKGNYYVSDGHHRMVAAMEIFKETGDDQYIKKLLENAKKDRQPYPPSENRSLPSRNFWGSLKNKWNF